MQDPISPTASRAGQRPRGTPGDAEILRDCTEGPYWLAGEAPAPAAHNPVPSEADVVVIGSGYTGLNAALQTARAGHSTVILEAGDPGEGCSTRNGGQISTHVKPGLAVLTRRFGAIRAAAIRREGERALEWIGTFIDTEAIDCAFRRAGRFHAAHTPRHYEALARATTGANDGSFAVPRADMATELGTDAFFGGVVFPRHATLDAGRYHRGLLTRVEAAGASVVARCAARRIERGSGAFLVETERGTIRARDVVLATNGYTDRAPDLAPWLRRRIIPIGSYIIATEALPPALLDRLMPTDRCLSDTRKVVYYYRPSPDRSRILFGGRVSAAETDTRLSALRLRAELVRLFPDLASARLSHSWRGTVAYSFDELAHIGQHDGAHYAMGYCGSGVSMASYLGMRMGQKIIGAPEGATAYDDLPFPTRPLYRGRPWFLPAAVAWYRARDRVEHGLALRGRRS